MSALTCSVVRNVLCGYFSAWCGMMNAVKYSVRRCDWAAHLVKAERSGWWTGQYVRDRMNWQIDFLSSSSHCSWLCFALSGPQIHLDATYVVCFSHKLSWFVVCTVYSVSVLSAFLFKHRLQHRQKKAMKTVVWSSTQRARTNIPFPAIKPFS